MTVTLKIHLTLDTIGITYSDVYKIIYKVDSDEVVLFFEDDNESVTFYGKHIDIEIS